MFINDNTKNEIKKKFKTAKRSKNRSVRNYLSETLNNEDDVSLSYLEKQRTHSNRESTEKELHNFNKSKKRYVYPIEKHLSKEVSYMDIGENDIVNICCYYVSTTSIRPFLKYLLFKYPESESQHSDLLVFPFFRYKEMEQDEDIVEFSKERITGMFDFLSTESFDFKGFIREDGDVNVIMQINEEDIEQYNEIAYKPRSDNIWFGLISELVDEKKILNFPINDSVTKLFLNNEFLLYLDDPNGERYVTPLVVYHGSYYKVTSFISVFGIKKGSVYSSLGPYYYFGNYEKALRYAVWNSQKTPMYIDDEKITDEEGRYTKGGIVRFAIFPGKMKVYSKINTHTEDKSKITQEKMETDEFIRLTAKLRDVDATWIKHYNSVYQGVITLDNGELNQRGPHWVVRNHQQQHALTYHYVDMEGIEDKKTDKSDSIVDKASYFGNEKYFIE